MIIWASTFTSNGLSCRPSKTILMACQAVADICLEHGSGDGDALEAPSSLSISTSPSPSSSVSISGCKLSCCPPPGLLQALFIGIWFHVIWLITLMVPVGVLDQMGVVAVDVSADMSADMEAEDEGGLKVDMMLVLGSDIPIMCSF